MQRALFSPTFFRPQSRPQRLTRQIESATFISKDIAPTARSGFFSLRIAAKRHRTCPRDHDDTRLTGGRPGQSNFSIVCNFVEFAADQLTAVGLFVFSAAAQSQTDRGESNCRGINSSFAASLVQAISDRAQKSGTAFRGRHVIARAAVSSANDAAHVIRNQRRSA